MGAYILKESQLISKYIYILSQVATNLKEKLKQGRMDGNFGHHVVTVGLTQEASFEQRPESSGE